MDNKVHLSEAFQIAENIVKLLKPHCEKIDIAGSIRRKKSEVKDIEIVCLPKLVALKDMFGYNQRIIKTQSFTKIVDNELGKVIKGNSDGKMMVIDLGMIKLDLFMPDVNDYYRQLAIRTGCAEFSHNVIAKGWIKIGWCGTDKGLRKIADCIEIKTPDGKSKWKCIAENPELPPVWQSEKEFFEWLGIKYVEPEERNL
jgi:DNA polymerase/3'-5' exonuclease PolX